ncbi:hypothetical protein [Paenibacillus sp. FSL P2-0136]|uniref:hypothetical protein n=1 Tax=Paenibacillus sp. FSL P2-0136 TaxID=2975317 RepID=UPI0030DD89C4
MAVRLKRTGINIKVTDHNELLNKGIYTHEEIDSALLELDAARKDFIDLDARLSYIQKNATGGGGDGGKGGSGGLKYRFESAPGSRSSPQTDFTIQEFTVGNNSLLVFAEGILMSSKEDYQEISSTKIRFNESIPANQRITFICLEVSGEDTNAPSEMADANIEYEYNSDNSIKAERTYSTDEVPVLLKEVAYTYINGYVATEKVSTERGTVKRTFQYDNQFNVVKVISRKL